MADELKKLDDKNEAESIGAGSVGSNFVVISEAVPLVDAGSDAEKRGCGDGDWSRHCCASMDGQQISNKEMLERYDYMSRRNKVPRVTSPGKFFLVLKLIVS